MAIAGNTRVFSRSRRVDRPRSKLKVFQRLKVEAGSARQIVLVILCGKLEEPICKVPEIGRQSK